MKKEEIKVELKKLGIPFEEDALKEDLEALLPTENKPPEPVSTAAIIASVADNSWKSIANQYVFIKEPQTTRARLTANKLAVQPKVETVVFPNAQDPDAKVYWGGINGFFFAVVIGVSVSVPKGIAEHITNSRVSNSGLSKNLMVINPFTGKYVNVSLDGAPEETKRRLGLI